MTPEDWGGKTICVGVSATTGEGVDQLLEMILLVAEMQNLRANPARPAMGSVLDSGRKSDAQTVAMANGKSNIMDVVTAVAETDVAVSTLVSVRDRVIQSYEDIMKMTI